MTTAYARPAATTVQPVPPATADYQSADRLTVVIVAMMVAASSFGLFLHGLYRDTPGAKSAFRGNDLATLALAVPILAGAALLARRGSTAARLVWLGMLAYNVYNYAFYLFGAAFNRMFLLYAALVAVSAATLVATAPLGLALRVARPDLPRRVIGGYLVAIGVVTGALWVVQALKFVTSATWPQVLSDSASPTSIIYALDLTLLMPACVASGMLLWRRRPPGVATAIAMNVMASVYMVALWVGAGFQSDAGIPDKSWFQPVNFVLAVASLVAVAVLIRRSQQGEL